MNPSKVFNFLLFLFIAVLFSGLFWLNGSIQLAAEKNQEQINALVDEIGTLSQENLNLKMELENQEVVLSSIEEGLGSFEETLSYVQGGEGVYESLFGQLSFESLEAGFYPQEDHLQLAEEDSTLDILVLGTNGMHTDTIMVASINELESKISLFSIPRDLYVNGRRINVYYSLYGPDQLKRMVEMVTGLTMEKYIEVDLQGFIDMVDLVGGVDVYVDEAIYDGQFPGPNGYEPYSIEVGHHHMDGTEALRYSRSRKSTSDFDRASRQQKVLYALRTKVEEMQNGLETSDLGTLFATAMNHVNTDLSLLDIIHYYQNYASYDLRTGLVFSTQNYLYSMINEGGAYILLPKSGDYSEIRAVVDELVH